MPDLTREKMAEHLETYDPESFPEWCEEFPPEREFEEDDAFDRIRMSWLITPSNYEPDDVSGRYGKEIETLMKSYDDEKILDLGCSYDSGVAALAGEDNNVVQLDKDRYSLSILNKYKKEIEEREDVEINSEIVAGDMNILPFAKDSFSVIFTGASDQFIDHSEVVRILDDGVDIIIGSGTLENYSYLRNYLDEESNFESEIVDSATSSFFTDNLAYLENIRF